MIRRVLLLTRIILVTINRNFLPIWEVLWKAFYRKSFFFPHTVDKIGFFSFSSSPFQYLLETNSIKETTDVPTHTCASVCMGFRSIDQMTFSPKIWNIQKTRIVVLHAWGFWKCSIMDIYLDMNSLFYTICNILFTFPIKIFLLYYLFILTSILWK